MEVFKKKGISIEAGEIRIGEGVEMQDVDVRVNGVFELGDYSRLGSSHIRGNNVVIGEHFFHTSGLKVGGGGRNYPDANLTIGDRCTFHDNFINVCEPVEIGNDVGFSNQVAIITHGYWLSVLDGHPTSFAGVKIGNGVIVGYRGLILMGVEIADGCVIGAQSVVTKNILKPGIYVGSPAKFIKGITPLKDKKEKMEEILSKYKEIARFHGISSYVSMDYPLIKINDFIINVGDQTCLGREDNDTIHLRDYLRRWGIRIYTKKGFGWKKS